MTDQILEFTAFLRDIGAEPERGEHIVADGRIRRYRVSGDRAGKRNGSYALWVRGEFASGWARNFKEGETYNWHSRANRMMTDSERRTWAKERETQKKEAEAAQENLRKRAAEKAARIWGLSKAGSHPYLAKKRISGKGSRVYRGALVIPAWRDGVLKSLQFIREDGSKRFLAGGEIEGTYSSIGRDLSQIYICEGYATAHSVHDATGKVAVWAFNAGNLAAVARGMRVKYPESRIVICADNDQWTVIAGQKVNPGIGKALAIAGELVIDWVWPDFPNDHPDRPTDFNDYAQEKGLEALRERLLHGARPAARGGVDSLGVVASETDPAPPSCEQVPIEVYEAEFASQEVQEAGEWRDLLICSADGKLVKGSLKNTQLILQHDERYKGIFKYDEFSHKIIVARCPKWESGVAFRVHELNDVDISETAASLEQFGLSPDRTRVHNAIEVTAHKNAFHPAREYFNSLLWDGKERLGTWLSYYLGAEDDDPDYLEFAGKKWLVAAVKRVFEPGCKFDHVLVMEGEQGRGKSTALKVLATFGDDIEESYFTDAITIADIQNKDTIQKIQGSVIVELAELAGFNKKDDEEIKRWITLQHDDCRLPYARTVTRFKRQFVLSATTNSYDYLKDPTGNRRYWPMKSSAIDIEALNADRKQLWAEAVKLYKSGLYIGPTETEADLAKIAQDKRRASDTWEEDVVSAVASLPKLDGFSTRQVFRELGIMLRDQDYKATRRVTNILTGLGYESAVRRVDGKNTRVWVKK